jgi:hypothetical protein
LGAQAQGLAAEREPLNNAEYHDQGAELRNLTAYILSLKD